MSNTTIIFIIIDDSFDMTLTFNDQMLKETTIHKLIEELNEYNFEVETLKIIYNNIPFDLSKDENIFDIKTKFSYIKDIKLIAV